ncbi:hypothetical protein JWZ98_03075 [Methylomonas sp. EFPC1]|uniref:hypothetical protein n=1 Tax=Methylomonas sp. EFPC1 TaxID=2812647 RepID=UPI001967E7A4|nr:hypothetical protein [Methylomonas sp. EFPC1]QSB01958.1 hypothetical protein JWZ98_03075 [Methylomonas sp. EFPC1]
MQNIIRYLFIASAALCVSSSYAADNSMKVINVTDFKFTLKDKPTVLIHFGESDTNHCTATVYRSKVKSGYTASSSKRSNTDFSINCDWNRDYFVESSNHHTFTDIAITALDKKSKSASMLISFKLVGTSTGVYLERHDVVLPISGKQFENLTIK